MTEEHKIILQEIMGQHTPGNPLSEKTTVKRRWIATCRCGWCTENENEKDCRLMAEEHGGPQAHLMTGPRIVITKSTVAIPMRGFPGDRWVWNAHNDFFSDEADGRFHGHGRTEDEAIDDLHRIDEVRRATRFSQSEGFPRNAAWLDFFKYSGRAE
jgi:hypothetical protein